MATVSPYQQAYQSLKGVYDPQTSLVNQQIGAIDPYQQSMLSSLDQAKVNAFRDITNQSNARGVLFSGVPIDQQAQYIGEKYLPAVANLKAQGQEQRFSLLGTLNKLNAQRSTEARGMVSQAEQNKLEREKTAQLNAYRNAQLQLGYARLQQSASRGSGGLTAYQQYQIANKPPSKAQVRKSLRSDIKNAFKNYDPNKDQWYTEKVVLPQLAQAYSELTPQELAREVYGYRSQVFGE